MQGALLHPGAGGLSDLGGRGSGAVSLGGRRSSVGSLSNLRSGGDGLGGRGGEEARIPSSSGSLSPPLNRILATAEARRAAATVDGGSSDDMGRSGARGVAGDPTVGGAWMGLAGPNGLVRLI